jgi:hypothetical protein
MSVDAIRHTVAQMVVAGAEHVRVTSVAVVKDATTVHAARRMAMKAHSLVRQAIHAVTVVAEQEPAIVQSVALVNVVTMVHAVHQRVIKAHFLARRAILALMVAAE